MSVFTSTVDYIECVEAQADRFVADLRKNGVTDRAVHASVYREYLKVSLEKLLESLNG